MVSVYRIQKFKRFRYRRRDDGWQAFELLNLLNLSGHSSHKRECRYESLASGVAQ